MTWTCSSFSFELEKPLIMGILNLTPDSFSDGGSYPTEEAAFRRASEMHEEGAAVIDVGGESTRPGAREVSPDEEWLRIGSVVNRLAHEGFCVSVDTRHAEVARRAVGAGASIINDVSGFRDPAMREVARQGDAGLVVMHMQGEPATMQRNPSYGDVVAEVRDWLASQAVLLEREGIAKKRICLDPGPGFGKTAEQTLQLMRHIDEIATLGYPVMAAVSRKSFLKSVYDPQTFDERDHVSAKEAVMACRLGARIVRAHNVALTKQALEEAFGGLSD